MSAPADWEHLRELFEAAVALPPKDRGAFLTDRVNGDTATRREVESLIAAHEAAGGFLRDPIRHGFTDVLTTNLGPPVLSAGTRLGAFEVIEQIGAGGMGEVYRARDTRLDRFVAIKVLPSGPGVAARGRERFEREARAISRLSHPRICTVHDVGVADLEAREIPYIVMELLDGETLATRLTRGPLSINDALSYTIDIADALVAAHAQAVVHRDLKPGNVMLTTTGVKLLDFGLAQLRTADGPPQAAAVSALTSTGMVFGTVPYMSPEQLRGEPVDARTDIFAFGALMHEMLTGQRPFQADSQAALIAAILEHDAQPVSELQPLASANLDRVVRKCLAKDPDDRWQTARDLRSELIWLRDGREDVRRARAPSDHVPRRRIWPIAAAGIPTAVAVVLGVLLWRAAATSAPARVATHHSLDFPPGVTLDIPVNGNSFAIAPDGSRVAYVGVRDGRTSLFIHSLADGKTIVVENTAGIGTPMFSPDSQTVAFNFAGSIKKVPATNGPVQLLVEKANNQATWLPDGRIVIGGPRALRVVGDDAHDLTKLAPGEEGHQTPVLTAEGSLLFSVIRGGYWNSLNSIATCRCPSPPQERNAAEAPTGGDEKREVLRNATSPRLVGGDALVYAQGRTLVATGFDSRALRVTGESRPLFDVQTTGYSGAPMFAVAGNGTLVYAEPARARWLVWIDRHGREEPTKTGERMYNQIRLSPDGTRVAANVFDADRDMWVFGLDGSFVQRLSSGPDRDAMPVWSRDGREIFFTTGERNINQVPADRSTPPVKVFGIKSPDRIHPLAITPNGKRLLAAQDRMPERMDLRVIELGSTSTVPPLIADSHFDRDGDLSPDGRWIVYASADATGLRDGQIVVRPFPDVHAARWNISPDGRQPIWSRDGREIFYRTDGAVMAVRVTTTPQFSFGSPVRLMAPALTLSGNGPTYDVSPDGKRFLFIKAPELDIRSLKVVLNWDIEVKAVLAGKGR
jgi:serine/threonine protein kinase